MTASQDAIVAVESAVESMEVLGEEFRAMVKYGRRNRGFIYGLMVLAVVVITSLTVILTAQANKISSQNATITAQAKANNAQLYRSCTESNKQRMTQKKLFNTFLDAPNIAPATPNRGALIAELKTEVNLAFTLHNCSEFKKGK
jgi:hypothetical protein